MAINYQKTYDTLSYEEGIEFRDMTMKVIREIYPHYLVTPESPQNPDVIHVANAENNVRIVCPLRDVYNSFSAKGKTESDLKEIILNEYSHILKQIEKFDLEEQTREFSWIEAQAFVQPRLTRIEEFKGDVEKYVHLKFSEEIITLLALVSPNEDGLIKRITKEQFEKWGITFEELYKKALDNLGELAETMEIIGTGKPKSMLWNETGFEFAASTILLGGMRYTIHQTIGSPYRFGMPSSFVLYFWREFENEEFQIEMKAMIKRSFDTMSSRLSDKIYEVNEKGEIKIVKDIADVPETPLFSNN